MAERAGGNTGPFDITILILLGDLIEIQIRVSERTEATVTPTLASPSVACVAARVTRPARPGARSRKRRPWNVRPRA
jgi:hypothetical protein